MKQRTVYFIRPAGREGPIKIGCSNAPASRMDALAIWSPDPLELIGSVPGSYRDESFLHRCFSALHSHHEWFNASPDLLTAINSILAAGTVDAVRHLTPTGSIRSRVRTADQRLRASYSHRIRWAEKKLREGGAAAWHAPDDVSAIISRWGSYRVPVLPTAAQLARLDEFLANREVQAVVPSWQRPKVAA